MASRPDHHARVYLAIGNPAAAAALQRFQTLPEPAFHPRAVEQIAVEFIAADAEAHGPLVMGFHFASAHQSRAEAGERLEDVVAAISVDVQFERLRRPGA